MMFQMIASYSRICAQGRNDVGQQHGTIEHRSVAHQKQIGCDHQPLVTGNRKILKSLWNGFGPKHVARDIQSLDAPRKGCNAIAHIKRIFNIRKPRSLLVCFEVAANNSKVINASNEPMVVGRQNEPFQVSRRSARRRDLFMIARLIDTFRHSTMRSARVSQIAAR